jgi:deazaflavin-dependent oxidoreductase (nitroreductase family)
MTNPDAQAAHFDLSSPDFVDLYNRRIAEDGAADINQQIIAEYRAAGGPTGIFTGAPILLLTTTGAKSGLPRTAPLVYTQDGDCYVIMGSRAGASVHPAWYHNLLANRHATIEVGTETFAAAADFAEGAERDRLFASHLARLPETVAELMRKYERETTRQFPVVVLKRLRVG